MMCINPIRRFSKLKGYIYVPCGNCLPCVNRYINDWTIRCKLELKKHKFIAQFVTITYNNDNLPADNEASVRDVQLFWKRLRINLERNYYKKNISYILTSENGELHDRIHYHAIIFGLNTQLYNYRIQKMQNAKSILEEAWQMGFVDVKTIGNVSKSISYILKYITKDKIENSLNISNHVNNIKKIDSKHRKNILLSSKNPSIGRLDNEQKKYIEREISKSDNTLTDTMIRADGRSYAIPRAIRKRLPGYINVLYNRKATEYIYSQNETNISKELGKLKQKYRKKTNINVGKRLTQNTVSIGIYRQDNIRENSDTEFYTNEFD